MTSGPLILLDVDETLIDQQSRLTVAPDVLRAAIDRAQARGAIIGLNSDSALETLERRARDYGLRGPLICERGAIVAIDGEVTFTNTVARHLVHLRDRFVQAFTEQGRATEYAVLLGDVNQLSDAVIALPATVPHRTLILVNGYRRASIAYYVRRWRQDGLHRDPVRSGEVFRILEDVAAELRDDAIAGCWHQRDIDANPDYGICIVHHRDTQKPHAVRRILEHAGDRPVYMIGNSMSDDLKHPLVIQCAVGNASSEYKARVVATGGLVAGNDLTAGVVELLDRITTT